MDPIFSQIVSAMALFALICFIAGYYIRGRENKVIGHFILGRGRVVSETQNKMILDCGCEVVKSDSYPINHTQMFYLDYKNCRDHTHDEKCKKK